MLAEGTAKKVAVGGFILISIATFTAGIVIWQTHDEFTASATSSPTEPVITLPPGPSNSELGVYSTAAVSCDAPSCSQIGKDILLAGGNVVDSAIATLFCMGVIQSQSMGIGGGFLMVFYNATEKQSYVLNAREKAPMNATEDMFDGNPQLSQRGGKAVAVPGELKGYWELYNRFGGQVPWSTLVEPTIKLCQDGFIVSKHAANALKSKEDMVKAEPSMAEVFVDTKTGNVFEQNDTIKRPVLARTLERIAAEGANILYTSDHEVMKSFVADLKDLGGIIEEEDMINYNVSWADPITMNISNGNVLHTVPPPGSGIILSFILKLLSDYELKPDVKSFDDTVTVYHRITEAFKHAFASRTYLGDPDPDVSDPEDVAELEELMKNLTSIDYINSIKSLIKDDITNNTYEYYGAEYYQPENHGTSHLSILGSNGDAIAVTSTVNLYFGAMIRSVSTGIIYNDEMDDFSAPNITNNFGVPPSPNNFIRPGKRPVSSMAPAIFTDSEGKARLIIGGAGGTQITTSVAYVSMRTLWFNETIKEAIDARRIHHQLFPMELKYETGFVPEYIAALEGKQHIAVMQELGESVVVGITKAENGTIYANSDFRKEGTIAGY